MMAGPIFTLLGGVSIAPGQAHPVVQPDGTPPQGEDNLLSNDNRFDDIVALQGKLFKVSEESPAPLNVAPIFRDLDEMIQSTVAELPSWLTIALFLQTLNLAYKLIAYVKKAHDRNIRVVEDWKKTKLNLEEQRKNTNESNDEWERLATELSSSYDTKLLSHTCCSVAIAQALIHHVVGDVVQLRVHPDDVGRTEEEGNVAKKRIDRIVTALNNCVVESLHWMTLGEIVNMLEVVCSS